MVENVILTSHLRPPYSEQGQCNNNIDIEKISKNSEVLARRNGPFLNRIGKLELSVLIRRTATSEVFEIFLSKSGFYFYDIYPAHWSVEGN